MNDRLVKFLSAENISQSQLADTLGVARASISHIVSGRNKPGFDFLENMAVNFPALNLEWLITGKGRMYKGRDVSPDATAASPESLIIKSAQIDRIVVFFEDGTFKEFK